MASPGQKIKLGCARALASSRRKPQRPVRTEGMTEKHRTSGNKPNPPHPARNLTSPAAVLTGRSRTHAAHGTGALRTPCGLASPFSGGPVPGAGCVCPDTAGSARHSLGGATGTSYRHHKAPFSSGTRPRGEPPSGCGTRSPHSRPYQWQAVRDVGPTVLLCGLIQGVGWGRLRKELCSPRRKGPWSHVRTDKRSHQGPGPQCLKIRQAKPRQ